MKATSKYTWITLGVMGLLSTAAVIHGQNINAAVAKVPFDFSVGNVRMPAATYRITEMNISGVTQIQNAQTGRSTLVAATNPTGGEATSSKLVFRCYSGNCFLSEIWYEGEGSGHGLNPGKLEKELAQGERKNVVVAMR